MEATPRIDKDISIVLTGAAGQGIQTVEHLLLKVLKRSGYHVFATKEYMSRVRGGSNSTTIRVSSERVDAYVDRIDILIPLSHEGIDRIKWRMTEGTVVIGEKETIAPLFEGEERVIIDIPFSKIASDAGAGFYSNIVATGVLACLFDIDTAILEDAVRDIFSGKGDDVIEKDLLALRRGCDIGISLVKKGKLVNIPENPASEKELLISGTDAVAMGAVAGGCDFISSYPMSPSTGVLVFLSRHAKTFGILSEQAEDEISAVNMAMGAWYGGARALVTTSGGGFDLMAEGVSLAGIIESPLVIHLAQRPGPGTGLPTRTEQGDLNLVLHSGHGEFPRVILAPGSLEEGFYLTARAFDLADRYQVPVFILTDQYFVDSFYNVPPFDLERVKVNKSYVKTDAGYRRYRITPDGVSPRGIPGYGEGVVVVDSDEHDEEGHITEDLELRVQMMDKRRRKEDGLAGNALEPELIGSEEYETLVIAWGSTRNALREAIETLSDRRLAALHFRQLYPLHRGVKGYLTRAKRRVVVESNATAQFGTLLTSLTGQVMDEKILKYNGLPFSVEELMKRLGELL